MSTTRDQVTRPQICLSITVFSLCLFTYLIFGDQLISQFLSLKVILFSKEIIMALAVCFDFVLFRKWVGSIVLFAGICSFG